ncbi:MAG: hypothetical protein BECKG1743F_GA0114225_101055 [Candidatus Kentron sp. G]|nr:MAG: hypothetical protein BECKG1743F_GA0114225_101055 [Candidatus Kentron sp. G]
MARHAYLSLNCSMARRRGERFAPGAIRAITRSKALSEDTYSLSSSAKKISDSRNSSSDRKRIPKFSSNPCNSREV